MLSRAKRVSENRISNCIILAGGLGSRQGMLTNYGEGIPFGNMNKATFPIVNRPNISRIIEQANKQLGIERFFISCFYMSGDVIETINHSNLKNHNTLLGDEKLQMHFQVRERLGTTGSATKEMLRMYSPHFRSQEYFMVIFGDTCFPKAALREFEQRFFEHLKTHPETLVGAGFVMRPSKEFVKEHHTYILDKDNVVVGTPDKPDSSAEADMMSVECESQQVKDWSNIFGYGLPLSTGIYIFNKKAFKEFPFPAKKMDYGRDIFPMLKGRMWGHIFPEKSGEAFEPVYFGLDCPEYLYRAQFAHIKAEGADGIPGTFSHKLQSYLKETVRIDGKVSNSVIGDNVFIGKKATISNSIIGAGSMIDNATIDGCLVMHFTYLNIRPNSDKKTKISFSIIGGRIRGGSFIDAEHMITRSQELRRVILAPDMRGIIEASTLALTEHDIAVAKEALNLK
jgi:NDP-sugar pyrophosphorylase family protein